MIRNAKTYRWIGIYDVADDDLTLIGYAGERPANEAARTRSTVVAGSEAVVPILGAESGIVIGILDAQSEDIGDRPSVNVAFLEECAAALRPLYD